MGKDFKLGSAKIVSREPLPLEEAKWIGLEAINWEDEEGKSRKWEAANRTTRSKGGVDAVAILALISHPTQPLSTVIVMQFRPPVNAVCVELPAGLIDEGETPEQAAERELIEETGYRGKVSESSDVIVSDPGMSSANMVLATVKVELKEGDELKEPEAKPDEGASNTKVDLRRAQLDAGEHIVKKLVPVHKLYDTLQDLSKQDGYTVDARLWHIAQDKSFTT